MTFWVVKYNFNLHIERIDGGNFDVSSPAGARVVGVQVARAIFGGLNKCGLDP
jgi:hypothetical protein